MPAEALQIDLRGRPITKARINRAMKLSMITCGLGTTFGLLAMPGTLVVTAFYRDSLGATNSQIGWLAGISLLSFSAGIFGSYLFDRVRSRKAVWIPLALYWRLSGFGLAGLTIYAARGGDKQFVIYASMVLIAVTYPAIYLGSPGWLGWFADLFPEKTRGRFIGRRLAVAYLIAIPVTLGAMFLVHHFGKASPEALMYAMAGVFTLAGIIGVVDIILCMWIPEPRRPVPKKKITIGESVKSMLTALTDARYRGFLFASMALSFAVQIRAPFFGPYFKTTLGVPYYWLAIAPCIFFLGQILTAKPWGLLADRFGSRPTMAIGVLWGIPLLLYFFASPENFAYILTAVHFLCGAVWTGLNISIFQMNMTQAPKGKTEACAGVKFAMVGIVGHFGAVLGGKLADYFESAPAGGSALPGIGGLGTMHKLILVSLGLQFLVALPLILRMRERKHRPVSPLLALLLTRNVLRLSANIGIIGGAYAPSRKVKALRTLKTPRDGIATEEIVGNLEDPDDEVRSEAVLALGRVGGPEALRRLTQLLADKGSGVRCEAAQAVGTMRDPAAIEHLLNALGDD
ncbi:MAG: MFS transporter, partial [Planctomycetia bacterium]|nr:MFS transporter [Planctomycetia bacterium]